MFVSFDELGTGTEDWNIFVNKIKTQNSFSIAIENWVLCFTVKKSAKLEFPSPLLYLLPVYSVISRKLKRSNFPSNVQTPQMEKQLRCLIGVIE